MKIALMNEFSQASKNEIVYNKLQKIAKNYGYEVYNTGMVADGDNPYLTYIHLGLQAMILLNTKAVDFVVTGCGTGQGANMSLNNYPGVVCGLVIDPADAFLFSQINNGNAISIPFAKGFGWGAELNIEYVFEKLLSCEKGLGYPKERRESQNKNAKTLFEIKELTSKSVLEILKSVDQEMLKQACSGERFLDCLFKNSQVPEVTDYIRGLIVKG